MCPASRGGKTNTSVEGDDERVLEGDCGVDEGGPLLNASSSGSMGSLDGISPKSRIGMSPKKMEQRIQQGMVVGAKTTNEHFLWVRCTCRTRESIRKTPSIGLKITQLTCLVTDKRWTPMVSLMSLRIKLN